MTSPVKRDAVWCAGEASGDFLASLVIPEFKRRFPNLTPCGVGGEKMRDAGLDAWEDSSTLSVRGYVEVIKRIPSILMLRHRLMRRMAREVPALYIGVDAPDFNLAIESKLSAEGVPCVHMVSPSIWAWRPERIELVRRAARHVLLIFPFEEAIYRKAGIPATYIGHPLAGIIPMVPDSAAARVKLGIAPDIQTVIAVLPGSRVDEVSGCGPVFFAACEKLVPLLGHKTAFVLPAMNEEARTKILSVAARYPNFAQALCVTVGQSHTVLESSDAVLVASGTATLEAALFKKPMVVGYKMPALTAWLMRNKGLIPYVSLPNILLNEAIVPEFLQYYCTADAIAYSVLEQLKPARRAYLVERFTQMHETLLRPTALLACDAIARVLA
ncbi:MAG TPA: lipid-A-disaccharide synthase [Sutterella sp.]|nr:lipid-A-disaccharide synthase [Sutterella sp.]